MKDSIHPKVYTDCVVTCACGSTFITASTKQTIYVEICSACHPFYTGQQKFVDTEGRIDKFKKKLILSDIKKKDAEDIKKAKSTKLSTKKQAVKQPSLKELLEESKTKE